MRESEMRILFINDYIKAGGAEVVLKNIVCHLEKAGHQIEVFTFERNKEFFNQVFPETVKSRSCEPLLKNHRRWSIEWFKRRICMIVYPIYMRFLHYDVVVAMKEGSCMKYASYVCAKRKLAWVHVDYRYLYWTKGIFKSEFTEKKCMQKFNQVICVSKAALESVKNVIGDPGNLCVRYNPIDFRNILAKAEEPCGLEKPEKKILFVAIGRLVKQKNYVTLIKICTELFKKYLFELWIIGEGEQRKELEDILHKTNCDCVRLLGRQDNPYKYLSQADFLISTSYWESYGLAIQEALILGVPVLTTKCPAIEECFCDDYGIMVECTKDAIESGMISILENPSCIEKYKMNIRNNFNLDNLWDDRFAQIEELLY